MDRETLEFYISFIASKSLVTIDQLLEWRAINKAWKQAIETRSFDVKAFLELQGRVRQLLYYDPNIYDKYSYRRSMLKTEFQGYLPLYYEIGIPAIEWCREDLDGDSEEVIYYIAERSLPSEYFILLYEYMANPSVRIRLYPPEVIKNVTKVQIDYIRTTSASRVGQFQSSKIILLNPMGYSKHYRVGLRDRQYVTILCYVNILDSDLLADFPDERFLTLTIDLADLDNKEEHYKKITDLCLRITKSLLSESPKDKIPEYIYPQNIAESCQSLDRCLEVLLENQNFNL